jgi:hypothetical protein
VPDNLIEQWLIGMRIADIIFEVAAWRKKLVADSKTGGAIEGEECCKGAP